MVELMDWDGPWSPDLVSAMLPVAVEISTKRERAQYQAVTGAIAAMFEKSVEYSKSLENVLDLVRKDQLASRGQASSTTPLEDRRAAAAQKLLDGLLPGLRRR